jgi:hypothetical protein
MVDVTVYVDISGGSGFSVQRCRRPNERPVKSEKKLLSGLIPPDIGEIWRRQGVRVAALEQNVSAKIDGTISDVVTRGLGETGRTLVEHGRISRTVETRNDPH